MPPETRYAKSGDVNIAYQVVGDGPLDLALVHGWVQSFDAGREIEPIERFYHRLASFSRLILFDKRGTGLSDRVAPDNLPTLETGWTTCGPSWTRWAYSEPQWSGTPKVDPCARSSRPRTRSVRRLW
jgi:pimeloyl-ACP methyl ester carboxylesterase